MDLKPVITSGHHMPNDEFCIRQSVERNRKYKAMLQGQDINAFVDYHDMSAKERQAHWDMKAANAELDKQVGDVNSTAKGSGARFNSGKSDLSLIPLHIIANDIENRNIPMVKEIRTDISIVNLLHHVGNFQFGADVRELYAAIQDCGSAWGECADVFAYGKKKYAAWNWQKGMPWSIPIACIGRHALALAKGEVSDIESKLPHRGHIMCNLVMLIDFYSTYPEGNDLPKLAEHAVA